MVVASEGVHGGYFNIIMVMVEEKEEEGYR